MIRLRPSLGTSPSSTLTRVLSGPYCTMLLGRHGRARHQDRAARARRRHARVGAAVRRRRERVFPEHQPQQGEPHARSEAAGGPRGSSIGCSTRPTCSSRTSGRARSRGSGSATTTVAQRYPRLVYCSISGFGQTGPRRAEAGYDAVMQAEGGLMSITGAADGPPYRLGVAIADIVSGMFAAQGITLALLARERTGADSSSTSGCSTRRRRCSRTRRESTSRPARRRRGWATVIRRSCRTRRSPRRTASSSWRSATTTSGGGSARSSARRRSRTTNASPPTARASRTTTSCARSSSNGCSAQPRGEWVRTLKAAGVPCGSVRDVGEVLEDEQLDRAT